MEDTYFSRNTQDSLIFSGSNLKQSKSGISICRFLKPALLIVAVLFICGSAVWASGANTQTLQPAALYYTGTYDLLQKDPNLTGNQITIAAVCRSFTYLDGWPQGDYLLNTDHDCFAKSNIEFKEKPESALGISPHSTAIGAILTGGDPNAFHSDIGSFEYVGAIPEAKLDIYEFWRFISTYAFADKQLDADILTMSVGTAFEDWWTRGIERMAQRQGLIIVAGIGNGSDVFDPALYPAAGANAIGVGVIDSVKNNRISDSLKHFSLASPRHSSSGPTIDGRSKPDIVAPGNCLIPDANNLTNYHITGDFSSFATPIVAATAGLLLQKAKTEKQLSLAAAKQGGNCVIKAILLNSATKLSYWHKGTIGKEDDHSASLDYTQGAGALNTIKAYNLLTAGRDEIGNVHTTGWDNFTIEKNLDAENVYTLDIPRNTKSLITATLAWNRNYSDEYPFLQQSANQSDLRLELWAVDPNNPDNDYMLDYSDSENNNVEHIYCFSEIRYSRYELIVVAGDKIAEDPNGPDIRLRYGLAWTVEPPDENDSLLRYDLNNDGKIDIDDITIVANNLDKKSDPQQIQYTIGDINTDGIINTEDISLIMSKIKP